MASPHSFCIWVLQVVALLGLLVFFLWLALRPSDPTYTVVEFSVSDAANDTGPSLALEIANSNKEGDVHYDDIALALYLHDHSVGGATIPSFYQRHGGTTEWSGRLGGGATDAVFRKVANGTAELRVGLVTAVRHRIWWWKSKTHGMDMQAALPVGADGRIAGKEKKIKLRRVRRKWRVRL